MLTAPFPPRRDPRLFGFTQKRAPYEDQLDADVQRIRTVQSAVHGFLDFDPTSRAHEW